MHIFLIEMPKDFSYKTPKKVEEGILDWKKINWIDDFENLGITTIIPYFLPTVLKEKAMYKYHCLFEGNTLKSTTKEKVE